MIHRMLPLAALAAVFAASTLTTSTLCAAEEDGSGRKEAWRAKMLEKFDADGDGKLNDDERAAAREARRAMQSEWREKMKAKMLEKFDKDGDGKLNDDERAAAREARRAMQGEWREKMKAKMLEKFDEDGDGKLSEEERSAAREAHKAKRKEWRAKVMEKYDADGDGKLSESERATAREEMGPPPRGPRGHRHGPPRVVRKMMQDPEEAFKKLDGDGDGSLSMSEFQELVEKLRPPHGGRGHKHGSGGK